MVNRSEVCHRNLVYAGAGWGFQEQGARAIWRFGLINLCAGRNASESGPAPSTKMNHPWLML